MRARGLRGAIAAWITLSLGATPSEAQQTVASTVRAIGSGTLRLQFNARDGVCGSGNGNGQFMRYYGQRNYRNAKREWDSECEAGPVRVAVDVSGGVPTALRFYLGGRWGAARSATDVGAVSASDAGAYFVRLAETAAGKVARDAMSVATLADSAVVWPTLLRIAKDASRDREQRKSAVFWLGQAVGDAAAELNGLAEDESEDLEIRKQAVFALSQRPKDEAVPALLAIVRSKLDPRLRRNAIFWLGQSGDPRAVAYFEEVLTKP